MATILCLFSPASFAGSVTLDTRRKPMQSALLESLRGPEPDQAPPATPVGYARHILLGPAPGIQWAYHVVTAACVAASNCESVTMLKGVSMRAIVRALCALLLLSGAGAIDSRLPL